MTNEERVKVLRDLYGPTELIGKPEHLCITTQRKELSFAGGVERLESMTKHVFQAPPGYWTCSEYAKLKGITTARMRERLQEHKEPGAEKDGDRWIVRKRSI